MAAENFVVAPEYLSIYVAGKRKISPPIDLDYGGIAANEDCITVPCLYWNEGDTTVTVANFAELPSQSAPSYDGVLNTPEKILMISEAMPTSETCPSLQFARVSVSGSITRRSPKIS